MTALIPNAKQQYTDQLGVPLALGQVFFYVPSTTTFKNTWQDNLQNSLNVNPVQLDASGRAIVYGNGDYRQIVQDRFGNTIWDQIATAPSPDLSGPTGSSFLGFVQSGTGAITRTGQSKMRDVVSVKDFGALGDGATNDSAAFTNALSTGKVVYIPTGTYLVNVVCPAQFQMFGENSETSIIQPFSATTAAFTVTPSLFFRYSRSFTDIGFKGTGVPGARVGVGVAFGKTDPSLYAAQDEFANSTTFERCTFVGLSKGVICAAGNLDINFKDCQAQANKYGFYFLDAKFGGVTMHAGCKYFVGCEISSNECGIYFHNVTDGFGGVSFLGTIIEANAIGIYCYSNNSRHPILFTDVWTEANGTATQVLATTGSAGTTITLDQWSGTTKTTAAFTAYAHIYDGTNIDVLHVGGFVTNGHLIATNSRILAKGARVETTLPFSGGPSLVDDVDSYILYESPRSSGGIGATARCYVSDYLLPVTPAISGLGTGQKQFTTVPRFNKQAAYGGAGSFQPFTSAATATLAVGTGPTTPVTGTTPGDGVIYATCNEFVLGFTATGQFFSISGATLGAMISGNWYVATFDVKAVSGTPSFYIGDLGSNQLMAAFAPPDAKWGCMAAIGKAASTAALSLYVSGVTGVSATVRLSAFQIRGFATKREAEAYLAAGIYVGA